MTLIASIDGTTNPRRVFLHVDTVGASVNPIDLYKEMRSLRRTDETLRKYNVFMVSFGNISKGGGKFTERYVQLLNCVLVPYDTSHVLTITGTVINDAGQEGIFVFDKAPLSPTTSVDIAYVPPQVEVIVVEAADLSGVLDIVKHIEQSVHVDEDALVNGDGSTRSPFDNVGDALTLAELLGLDKVHIHSDITIDRNFKNFVGIGIGNPKVDCAGYNLDKSEFEGVTLAGSYTGRIVARNCDLANNLSGLDGKFRHCGLGGDLFCADNSDVEMIDPFSNIEGPGRPTISASSSAGSSLGIRGMRGGLTIKNIDHIDSDVSVEMATGALTLDSTCILGDIIPRGSCDFVDNSNGCIVDKSGLDSEQVWKGIQI